MNRIRVVAMAVVLIAALAIFVIFVGNAFVSAPSSVASEQYQISFVGAGFNQTKAARNSIVTGSLQINITQPSLIRFTLGDQKYYTFSSMGNGSTFSTFDSFQNGSVSVDGTTYLFGTLRDCTAAASSTNTIGNTVIDYASCNASSVTPAYSLQAPSNARLGSYLIDFDIQSQSLQNFANFSNNLVYVLTVKVSE